MGTAGPSGHRPQGVMDSEACEGRSLRGSRPRQVGGCHAPKHLWQAQPIHPEACSQRGARERSEPCWQHVRLGLLTRGMFPMVQRVHLQGLAEERRKTLALRVVVAMAREVMRRIMCWLVCPRIVDACGFPTSSHIVESHDKPGQGVLGLPPARTLPPPCWVSHGTEPAGAVLGLRRQGEAWRQRRQRSTGCPMRSCS